MRELITFAMLAALGGCDPQVRSHVAANLNVGNDRQTLIGVIITVLLPFIGYPRTLNALAAINEVAPASKRDYRVVRMATWQSSGSLPAARTAAARTPIHASPRP